MYDPIIKDIAKLHGEIHAHDPAPKNERERQVAYILPNMQRILLELNQKHVGPRTLELSLLYNWLRLATLNRGYAEKHFTRFANRLDMVTQKLVHELKILEAELEDEGPSPAMDKLGGKVQQLRDLFGAVSQGDLPRHEVSRQTDLAVRAFFGFTAECLDKGMHPGLLESAMLYYWLRVSTITANIPERFFQKLERQWPTVVERVGIMTDTMLREPAEKPRKPSNQEPNVGLTKQQIRLARRIDEHVQRVLASGGGDEELLMTMHDHMTPFKQLLDSTTRSEMEQLCEQYDGFYQFAKLLERLAAGIADGTIPVPK